MHEPSSNDKRAHNRRLLLAGIALGALLYFVFSNRGYFAAQWRYTFGVRAPVLEGPHLENAATGAEPVLVTPDRLWIEAIGLSEVPIIYVTEKNEAAYQSALKDGVAHFPGTAEIGRPGNAYVFGHSSDYASSNGKYKTIFALLSKLKTGDRIIASDRFGTPYEYAVTESFVVAPDDVSVLDQFHNEKSLLTLQTSWPLGTALKRYIVRAEMVEGETLSAPPAPQTAQ